MFFFFNIWIYRTVCVIIIIIIIIIISHGWRVWRDCSWDWSQGVHSQWPSLCWWTQSKMLLSLSPYSCFEWWLFCFYFYFLYMEAVFTFLLLFYFLPIRYPKNPIHLWCGEWNLRSLITLSLKATYNDKLKEKTTKHGVFNSFVFSLLE